MWHWDHEWEIESIFSMLSASHTKLFGLYLKESYHKDGGHVTTTSKRRRRHSRINPTSVMWEKKKEDTYYMLGAPFINHCMVIGTVTNIIWSMINLFIALLTLSYKCWQNAPPKVVLLWLLLFLLNYHCLSGFVFINKCYLFRCT